MAGGINSYSYVLNSPSMYWDAYGLASAGAMNVLNHELGNGPATSGEKLIEDLTKCAWCTATKILKGPNEGDPAFGAIEDFVEQSNEAMQQDNLVELRAAGTALAWLKLKEWWEALTECHRGEK
jgi:hypothetical protein